MTPVHINKEIQGWIDTLVDLFCLEDAIPAVELSLRKDNRCGVCYYPTTDYPNRRIVVGCKGGKVRLGVLVHEFLHAAGFEHTNEINGWANFHHYNPAGITTAHKLKGQYDNYSRLIVKDLTGDYEKFL